MSYTYDQRKRQALDPSPKQTRTSPTPGPSLQAIAAGLARPSAQQMGHRVDLPEAMRQKMENAFGTDFSNVRLYESETVAQAGAEAITQGNQVAFAPGKLDFSSQEGQARLGHELSHVASQARGESTGRGFLLDRGLEHQADMEGARAAAGESVYSGPVTHALSSAAPSPAAAGAMQAKRGGKGDPEEPRSYRELQAQIAASRGNSSNGLLSSVDDTHINFAPGSAVTAAGSTFTLDPNNFARSEQYAAYLGALRNNQGGRQGLAPAPAPAKKKKWFGR